MATPIRYSVSAILGLFITAFLFIGMLSLLGKSKTMPKSTDADINFSFVKEYIEPEVKSPTKPEIPEPKQVTQPPAAPKLAVETNNTPDVKLPLDGLSHNKPNLLSETTLPTTGIPGNGIHGNPGGIKAAVPPMYPPQELMKKTEGWVKLQISVNEFGGVSTVSIIDAKPKRVFDAAAKKAVKKWKFYPRIVDGQAVSFIATQTIEFTIDQ